MRVVFALMVVLAVAAAGLGLVTRHAVQPWHEDPLEQAFAASSIRFVDQQGTLLADRAGPGNDSGRRRFNRHDRLAFHEFPRLLMDAFVIAEDKRFREHRGVDWLARIRAGWLNATRFKVVSGASTITEQVVKMLRPRPRTVWSRWIEGFEARALEDRVGKAGVLRFYLNQVPFAANRRGVAQAADYYFGRSLGTLNERELLALAVFVRAPSYLNPKTGAEDRLARRIDDLAQRMNALGKLPDDRLARVKAGSLELAAPEPAPRVAHFLDYVRGTAVADSAVVRTTLDAELQGFVQRALDARVASLSERRVSNGAALVVDHRTNEVRAWAVANPGDGAAPGSAYNAVLQPRQPGSTLKPFIYALALEQGYSAATRIPDRPLQEQVGLGVHEYNNYSRRYYGEVSMREALGNSLNIPAVHMIKAVGMNELLGLLNAVGVRSLDQHPGIYGDGLALGNGAVSLFELVQAYTILARNGLYSPLSVVQRRRTESHRVLDEQAASLTSDMLSDPGARALEFGHNSVLNLPIQTAAKTGTSNDFHDAWVVAYNARYLVGVWMGNLDFSPMDEVTGTRGPAGVMRSIMDRLNRRHPPGPLYLSDKLRRRPVCRSSGRPARKEEDCERYQEYFLAGQSFKELQTEGRALRIDQPTPGLRMARDPRVPDEYERFRFRLNRASGVDAVIWRLNGRELARTANNFYDWPIEKGEHVLTAEVTTENGERHKLPPRRFRVY